MSEKDDSFVVCGEAGSETAIQAGAAQSSAPADLRRVDRLRERRPNRIVRIGTLTVTAILGLVVLASVCLLVLQAFASSGRPLAGYRPLEVLSGSMAPAMPVGSIIITKTVDPTTIKVGDIITFLPASAASGTAHTFATHRVFKIEGSGSQVSFVTKGDANNALDNAVPASHVIGRVVVIMPFVGRLTNFVRSFWGWLLMIVLPGGILVAWEIRDLVRGRKKTSSAAKILVLAICLFGSAQPALASTSTAGTTVAYFSTSVTANFKIQTGFWGSLSCEPGKAKAVRHDDHCAAFPIASRDENGDSKLDFGELPAGNSNNSNDVFRVMNGSKGASTVTVSAQGAFTIFVDSISLGNGGSTERLAAGAKESVTIKLAVPCKTRAGDYRGTITVTTSDGQRTISIPVLVTINCGEDAKAVAPTKDGESPTSTLTIPSTTIAVTPTEPTITVPAIDTTTTSEKPAPSTTTTTVCRGSTSPGTTATTSRSDN